MAKSASGAEVVSPMDTTDYESSENNNDNTKFLLEDKHCSVQEIALLGALSAYSASKNSIVCHDSDCSTYGDQYESLLRFINVSPEPYKTQLAHFVYPMFVNIYLQLIVSGASELSKKFFDKHSEKFRKSSKSYAEAMDNLRTITTVEGIEAHSYFSLFRKDRYLVSIPTDCLEYLMCFLKDETHMVLIQLLNSHFTVQSSDFKNDKDESMRDDNVVEHAPVTKSTDSPDVKNDKDESMCDVVELAPINTDSQYDDEQQLADAIARLELAITDVKKKPMGLPSLGVYSVDTGSFRLSSFNISEDFSLLAGGLEQSSILLWKLSSHTQEGLTPTENTCLYPGNRDSMLCGHKDVVCGLSFSHNRRFLFSCSLDRTVRVWNLENRKCMSVYNGHNYPVWDIDVSRFSVYFATASRDLTARIWVPDILNPLRSCVGHNSDVNCVRFHPNSNYIATGSSDKTVRLWSVQDGRCVRIFVGHERDVFRLAFSPDGCHLASASDDGVIKVWHLSSGLLMRDLRGHEGMVRSLCFNSDGNILVSCGGRKSVRYWDIAKSNSYFKQDRTACAEKNTAPVVVSCFRTKIYPQLVSFMPRNIVLAVGTVQPS